MRKKLKYSIIILGIIGLVNLFFVFLLKVANVKLTGTYNTSIGLGSINLKLRDLIGTSKAFDIISTIILVIAFLIVAAEIALAIYELVKRKDIEKLDNEIWALSVTYAALAFIFAVFNYALIINVRPVVIDGKLESSYPSTHVLVSLTVFLTGITMTSYLVKDKKLKLGIDIALIALSVLVVITRMLSGKHWFTDIIGGILASGFLYWMHITFIIGLQYKKGMNLLE